MKYSIAVTGHRPQKLGIPKGTPYTRPLLNLCISTLAWFEPSEVVCGMALGFDLAIAAAARELGIPLIAAIPCDPHLNNPTYWELRHYAEQTGGVYIVSPGPYAAWKMHKRNEWMIDRALLDNGHLIALWDGTRQGGTYRCLQYAQSKDLESANIWPDWLRLQGAIAAALATGSTAP